MKVILKLLFVAAAGATQLPGLTIADYEMKYGMGADTQVRTAFWSGVANTITTFRIIREKDGLPPLYCLPSSEEVSPAKLMSMTDQLLKKAPETAKSKDAKNFPITDLALITLMKNFPCK